MLSGEKYKRNTLKKSYFRRAKSEALDNIAVEAKIETTTLLGAHDGDTERLRESRARESNCDKARCDSGEITEPDGNKKADEGEIIRLVPPIENDQFKKINSKLKTQLLDRYFIVACLLGLTEVCPMLGFFLSQALPVGFESGRRDRFV